MSNEQSPTLEQLTAIVARVRDFVQAADDHDLIEGRASVPGSRRDPMPLRVFKSICDLERVTNPARLAFDDRRRDSLCTSGWPDVMRLSDTIQQLRTLTDHVVAAAGLEAIYGESAPLFRCHESDEPPAIPEATLSAMLRAASRIESMIGPTVAVSPEERPEASDGQRGEPLTDRQSEVLAIIRSHPGGIYGKVIAPNVDGGVSEDSIRKTCGELRRLGLTGNRRGAGYFPM